MCINNLPTELIYNILQTCTIKDLFEIMKINHLYKLISQNVIKSKLLILLNIDKYYSSTDDIPFNVIYHLDFYNKNKMQLYKYHNLTNVLFKSYKRIICDDKNGIDIINNMCYVHIVIRDNIKIITNNSINKYVEKLIIECEHQIHESFFECLKDLKHLKYLSFGDDFNQDISKYELPHNLKYLSFGYLFDQNIKNLYNVKYLSLGYLFNKDITHITNNNLTHLIYNWKFNADINNINLNNYKHLTHLTFGCCPKNNIANVIFPETLTNLTFDHEFNQDITNIKFNNNLKYLTFNSNFNQDIQSVNFNNLTHITFGWFFNQDITNVKFPNSIICLKFGYCFNQNVDNIKHLINYE